MIFKYYNEFWYLKDFIKESQDIFIIKFKYMEFLNQEFIQEFIRLTWRNPAFMALAIALVWLIPQLFIRKIMSKKYEQRKIEIQKNKIQKLYPTNTPK